jgi:ectoine hydroxylase-related dioxygenase (phytanoyl-CoA dioxygenase family)
MALTADQIGFYRKHGFLLVEGAVRGEALRALQDAAEGLRERGMAADPADLPPTFEFETLADGARSLRQILSAADEDEALWAYASESPMVDMVADLIGPDVMYRETTAAFKRPGGRGFPWHQDFAYVPATNLASLMTLTFLTDVTEEMGPTLLIPGSHRGPLVDHYGTDGAWLGRIPDEAAAAFPTERVFRATGPAGSVLINAAVTLHRAEANRSNRPRPMLVNGYQATDCKPVVEIPYRSRHRYATVRGRPTDRARAEAWTMRLPPDWDRHAGVRIDNLNNRSAAG